MCNQIDSHRDTCKALESELRATAAQLDASRMEFAKLKLCSEERIRQLESEKRVRECEYRLHAVLRPLLRGNPVGVVALGAEFHQQISSLWRSISPSFSVLVLPMLQVVIV